MPENTMVVFLCARQSWMTSSPLVHKSRQRFPPVLPLVKSLHLKREKNKLTELDTNLHFLENIIASILSTSQGLKGQVDVFFRPGRLQNHGEEVPKILE